MPDQRENPSSLRRFLWFHLPVILYAAGIIVVSSLPNLKSPQLRLFTFDKVAHFLEYAVFALLVFRSFYNLGAIRKLRRALLLSALFVCVFALLDEFYQHFIPGRHSDPADFVTDLVGAMLILVVLGLWHRRRREPSS